jgi:hypothetical protein
MQASWRREAIETGDEALGVALRGLAIDEQSQALLE